MQCRFTDLYEYMCHITLIINKGMCQLPLGYRESRGSRWVRRLGISVSVQASLLPIKGVLTFPYRWGERPSAPAAFPQQIFKEGQIGLSSVEQGGHRVNPSTALLCTCVPSVSHKDNLHFSIIRLT